MPFATLAVLALVAQIVRPQHGEMDDDEDSMSFAKAYTLAPVPPLRTVAFCATYVLDASMQSRSSCMSACTAHTNCSAVAVGQGTRDCVLLLAPPRATLSFCDAGALVSQSKAMDVYVANNLCPPFPTQGALPCLDGLAEDAECVVVCQPGFQDEGAAAPVVRCHQGMWLSMPNSHDDEVPDVTPTCTPIGLAASPLQPVELAGPAINHGVLYLTSTALPLNADFWKDSEAQLACRSLGFDQPAAAIAAALPLLAPAAQIIAAPSLNSSARSDDRFVCPSTATSLADCRLQPGNATTTSTVALTCFGALSSAGSANGPDALVWKSVVGNGGACGNASSDSALFFALSGLRQATTQLFLVPAAVPATLTFSLWFGDGVTCSSPSLGEYITLQYTTDASLATWVDWYTLVGASTWHPYQLQLPAFATPQMVAFRWMQQARTGFGTGLWAVGNITVHTLPLSTAALFDASAITRVAPACFDSLFMDIIDAALSVLQNTSADQCLQQCLAAPRCSQVFLWQRGRQLSCVLLLPTSAMHLDCPDAAADAGARMLSVWTATFKFQCPFMPNCSDCRQNGTCFNGTTTLRCAADCTWVVVDANATGPTGFSTLPSLATATSTSSTATYDHFSGGHGEEDLGMLVAGVTGGVVALMVLILAVLAVKHVRARRTRADLPLVATATFAPLDDHAVDAKASTTAIPLMLEPPHNEYAAIGNENMARFIRSMEAEDDDGPAVPAVVVVPVHAHSPSPPPLSSSAGSGSSRHWAATSIA